MSDIVVETWGTGTRVVLVHGSLATGPLEWQGQRPLAEAGFEVVVPTRRAYTTLDRGEDFVADGEDIADLLGDGAHLVGHSYGALVAMEAARRRPDAVHSLVLAEPPLFDIAPEHPTVLQMQVDLEQVLAADSSDEEFLASFLAAVGTPLEQLDDHTRRLLEALVLPLRRARQPWDSPVPIGRLCAASYPIVVVSGGHHPAFTAICETLADMTGGRLATVTGAGHEVQAAAEDFNALLLEVWRSVGGRAATARNERRTRRNHPAMSGGATDGGGAATARNERRVRRNHPAPS